MSEQEKLDFNPYLFNLITMFTQATWCQLGKTPSPVDGKISKDLKSAQFNIEMLIMIRDKMEGNLSKKESELLNAAISDLQINYADEAAKPESKSEDKKSEKKEEHPHDCGCCGHDKKDNAENEAEKADNKEKK